MRWLAHLACAALVAGCSGVSETETVSSDEVEASILADLEHQRLKAMVEGDFDFLDRIHADDFELINPLGVAVSKEGYLKPMKEGKFRYLAWEPTGTINSKVQGDAGAVRYRSMASLKIDEETLPPAHYFHTDFYQRRNGVWQVVFSQATLIQE